MDYVCCLSHCPSLLSNNYVYSSDDNLNRGSNLLFEQKLTSYAKRISQRFSLSNYQKENSEEFEKISLIDNSNVSFV